MNYKKLLQEKLIKREKSDFKQIEKQIRRARKDLVTAEANLLIDLTWAITIAYHAMLRASRALVYSQGYLPTTKRSHKTLVQMASMILGNEYADLIARFNRLRRKRHDFIYDSENHTTSREAKLGIETARKLIDKIISIIAKEQPQIEFEFRA